MPSPETLAEVRKHVATADAALSIARDESRKLRAAGLTAHADQLDSDIKARADAVNMLKRAYNL